MGNNIKGITIEIGGDTTKLDKALTGVNKEVRGTQAELREVEKLLKMDPKNTEALAQKQTLLKNAISETKEKLDILKTAEGQVQEQFARGEISEEQYRALKREIESTELSLRDLESQAENSKISLEGVGDAFQNAGGKVTDVGTKLLPVTAAVTALGSAGIAAAMELDDGYDTIITKTGATGEALKGLTDVANNVFTNMPTDMDKAGTAVGEINTRFGVTGEVLETLSTQFIQFSEINGTDLNNSIGKVDKIMEQWNIDMSETGDVLGLITKKGQDTGISVDTLMDSVQKNGATFKEMGLDMVQSVDLLAQFEANGINAETAIAGLRKSVKIYTDQGKSTDEALKMTIESIKNAETETEALSIAQEVFGTKGASEMSNAIREGRISLDSLSSSMEDFESVVEDTFNATLDPWDDATVAMNNLKLAGSELGQTILETLQPIITKVVERIKEFTQWFTNLNQSQKETIIKVAAVVAAIGPALIIFGKMSTGIGAVIKTVSKLKVILGASGGLSSALAALTGPVGIVIAAIAALAVGFIALYKTNDEFREKVNTAMEKVKLAFSQMWEKVKPIIEKVKEAFLKLLESLQPVFDFIVTYMGAMVNGITKAVVPIVTAIQNIIDFVTNIINAITSLLKGDFEGFFTYLIEALKSQIEFVINIISAVVNYIIGFFEGFGIDIKQIFLDIWNSIVSVFQNVGQWFGDKFTEAYTNVTNIFSSIGEWFGARWQDIQNVLATVAVWFLSMFTNAYINVTNVFAAIGQWFSARWQDIKNALATVANWFLTMFRNAYTNVTNVFAAIGQWFGARWQDIQNALAAVADWFLTMFTNAYTNVTNVFAAIGEWFGARWQDIQNALAAVADWFLTMFRNAYTNVTNVFAAIGQWFGARWQEVTTALSNVADWFGTQFQNAWTNIKNAFSNVTSFFTDLWEKIKGCFVDVGVKIGTAVGDAFKSAINGCLSSIENVVNKFIGMINGVIGIINEIPGVSLGKINALSLPRLAKGGVLSEGTAMVAEAGPELLSMVNGKAVVTPLTGSARNQAAESLQGGGGYQQNIHISSPKALSPYEIARQTRLQTRSMILAVQRG